MSASTPTVLVAGAAGDLGRRIAAALLRKPGLRVRLGLRDPARDAARVAPLLAAGAEPVRLDVLGDGDDALRTATDGATAVVSALQGGPDVIVEGQGRLLDAALASGVERFVPSDFSMDHLALAPGENPNSDWRRAFDERLMAAPIGWTILLNGGFTEAVLSPFFGLLDEAAGAVRHWGEGDVPLDLTAMDDAAAYLAEMLFDPGTRNRVVQVVGESLTPAGLAAAHERATGRPTRVERLGSLDEGYAELERRKAAGVPFVGMLPLMYLLPMLSGRARLRAPENARWPSVRPTGVEAWLRTRAPGVAPAAA